MTPPPDAIDAIEARLAQLYPDLDTSGFAVTGRILRLARHITARRVDHLTDFGLTPGDFDVLATVRRVQGPEGVNPGTVLESVLITSGGLTKRLDRLESAGLLERRPDPDDRRGTLARLTDEGTEVVDAALQSLVSAERDLVAEVMTDRQMDQAAALLRRLHAPVRL